MPYLHVNMRKIKCKKFDQFIENRAEFYFVFRVYSLEPNGFANLAQGFSTGVALDDGYAMREGEEQRVNDPRFTISLPPAPIEVEQRMTIEFILYEADHSAENVKKAYTNEAAEKYFALFQQNKMRRKEAMKRFNEWLSVDDGVAKAALDFLSGGNIPLTAVRVGFKVINFIPEALVAFDADDFCGRSSIDLMYRNTGSGYEYRWIDEEGIGAYGSNMQPVEKTRLFRNYDLSVKVNADVLFQFTT
jgi:hypothetical protein